MVNEVQPSAAETAEPFLRIDRLSKHFGDFVALNEVSLDVFEGEFVCFLGPSGCGKTTLLRAIAGLDIQTSGTVIQAGQNISPLPPSERDFGIVFQSYALFPNLNVEKNISFGLENEKKGHSVIRERVAALLDLVGLPDQGKKYPAQLSGGQQQRIALARALATSPGLLLLDEPLSALDAKVRTHLRHEMKTLQRRLGVTTIMVTHDQEEALTMADRIVVMNHGVIEQVGSPTQIYREPGTLFVADFIGAMNQINGESGSKNTVRIGEIELQTRDHDRPDKENVIVAIRPEDIIPSTDQQSTQNSFQATVVNMEFLGSFWRVALVNQALGVVELEADMSINAIRRLGIEEGKDISIELPASSLWVFPASQG